MRLPGVVVFAALAGFSASSLALPRSSPNGAPGPTPGPTPAPLPASSPAARPLRGAGIRPSSHPLAPGERISLDLKDADLRDVLRSFGRLARLNLVIDPEVRGSVTVRLHDVRWEDALEVILRSNGLASVREDTLVRVGTPPRLAPEPER